MQPLEALGFKGFCLRARVVVEDGCLVHVAEFQAHALAILQIDGGKKDHSRQIPSTMTISPSATFWRIFTAS